MKRILFIALTLLLVSASAFAQPQRVAAGLAFSTKKRFNGGDTGNPGLNLKTWITLDKKKAYHIVPSVTVFNPLEINHTSHLTTNYLFHGDLDFQFLLFHDKTLRVVGFTGLNYTHIISKNKLVITIPDLPVDATTHGFGPNIGAALEMRMNPFWDFMVSGKYSFAGLQLGDPAFEEGFLIAPLSALVLQVQAVYYFRSRGKGYGR